MEDVRDLMEAAIRSDIENMNDLELGSEQRSRHEADLAKLYGVYNEEYKVRYESVQEEMRINLEKDKIDREIEIKQQSAETEAKQGKINNILKGAGLVIGGVFTAIGFKLEKDGYILPKGISDRVGQFGRFLK